MNPLQPKLDCVIFKKSARTAKKTPHFTVTEIKGLTLFNEVIAVYSDNRTKLINRK
jgi:hypothetical protein